MLPACEYCGELGHTPSGCRQRLFAKGPALPVDFDEAGRQVLERVGAAALDGDAGRHGALTEIWRGASSSGKVYVGSLAAASDHKTLKRLGITHVVNCMNRPGLNVQPDITYLNFPVEHWDHHVDASTAKLVRSWRGLTDQRRLKARTPASMAAIGAFFASPFDFVRTAVEAGGNVLIHCFAGAHRAGTTGVAWLMHAERLSAADALRVAQRCRPIIDPKSYAELYSLLLMLQQRVMLFGL